MNCIHHVGLILFYLELPFAHIFPSSAAASRYLFIALSQRNSTNYHNTLRMKMTIANPQTFTSKLPSVEVIGIGSV